MPVLEALQRSDPALNIMRLKRNFGQTAALAAGLAHASGEIVVMMDGDRQNDPADIPAMLAKLDEGNDLVVGLALRSARPVSQVAACLQ